MSTITIGSSSRSLSEAEESWITQNVNGRRRDGLAVCVQVRIQEQSADVILTTPGCPSGLGGGRAPNPTERRIIELWEKHGLNKQDFAGGQVVVFLKQLSRLI